VDALRSSSSVEARAVCSSRALDLFPVTSCFESEAVGVGSRSAVDCSALEWVPSSTVVGGWVVEVEEDAEG
jgi:hypothetical protein